MAKKIVVFGLLPRQFHRVRRAVGGVCVLVHGGKLVRDGTRNGCSEKSVAVVAVRFVSHKVINEVLCHWPRESVHFAAGCVKGVSEKIRSLV